MEIQILTQPKLYNGKNYTLGEQLNQLLLSKKPKFIEATFFFGLVKTNAFDEIFENIKTFILNGGNVKFYLSQPQKGTVKKITNSLLELGCEVYMFKSENPDSIPEFQYKGVIFESKKKSTILLSSGNFTLSGLFEGYNTTTQLSYDLVTEKEEFKTIKNSLFSEDVNKIFEKVTRENFDTFFSDEIPTIEEFTRKDVEQKDPIITSLDDINIDIEIDENVSFLETPITSDIPKKEPKIPTQQPQKTIPEVIEEVEFKGTKYFVDDDEALDIEHMLFSSPLPKNNSPILTSEKENITTHNEEEKAEKVENSKIIAKSTNLSKTSIFMIQIPKITKKGINAGEIKIPLYLRDLIPAFWGWPKNYSVTKNSNEKSRICMFRIIDTTDANTIITDNNAKLFQREGESSFSILSKELVKLELHENDIIRFIKTESANGSYFTCEIVRTDANEYPIWEQFCTTLLKGSKRKYGIM